MFFDKHCSYMLLLKYCFEIYLREKLHESNIFKTDFYNIYFLLSKSCKIQDQRSTKYIATCKSIILYDISYLRITNFTS